MGQGSYTQGDWSVELHASEWWLRRFDLEALHQRSEVVSGGYLSSPDSSKKGFEES